MSHETAGKIYVEYLITSLFIAYNIFPIQQDENDNTPTFNSVSYQATIYENLDSFIDFGK